MEKPSREWPVECDLTRTPKSLTESSSSSTCRAHASPVSALTSLRHTGQVTCAASHASMQRAWNTWPHLGSSRSDSSSAKSARHTAHWNGAFCAALGWFSLSSEYDMTGHVASTRGSSPRVTCGSAWFRLDMQRMKTKQNAVMRRAKTKMTSDKKSVALTAASLSVSGERDWARAVQETEESDDARRKRSSTMFIWEIGVVVVVGCNLKFENGWCGNGGWINIRRKEKCGRKRFCVVLVLFEWKMEKDAMGKRKTRSSRTWIWRERGT